MWPLCLPALMWVALLCLTQPAMAEFTQANGPKLTASNPVGSAEMQGFSVAVSTDGNTAIIGAPFDSGGAGAAWVFKRSSNGTWTQQIKLTADDAAGCSPSNLPACPQFGWSVALSADGNTALVGGPGDNALNGAAWLFTQSNGVWSNPGVKLTGTGAVGFAQQGYAVALSADGFTAIIGGWNDNSALGAAWVFIWNGTNWTQQGAKLVGTGATDTTNILQGFSVALSGDGNLAIIGGPNDGDSIGAAWLFSRSAGSWTQATKLVGLNGNESEQGFSVALSRDGSTALVGGPGQEMSGPGTSGAISQSCSSGGTAPACPDGEIADTTETTVNMSNGAAWVFTRSSGVWGPGDMLAATPAPISSPGQGFSVALSDTGTTVLLGGPTDNANTGAAWAYTLRSATWTPQTKKLVATGAAGAAGQGASVALSHDGINAIIGGPLDQAATGATWAFVANFPLTVTVSGNSGGTITSSPFNIDCTGTSGTCDASYSGDAMVTLSATPGNGYIFTGWSGACSGTGSCVVTMSAAESVTATFAQAGGSMAQIVAWVGPSGSDTGTTCDQTAPCATFQYAVGNVSGVTQINCLGSGNYGAVTITASIIIDCGTGNVGTVSISGPATAIAINTNSAVTVVLRHLSLNGNSMVGTGISGGLFSGTLIVADCLIQGFNGSGLDFEPSGGRGLLQVSNSEFFDNQVGIGVIPASGQIASMMLNRVELVGNSVTGLALQGSGVIAGTMRKSLAADNGNYGVYANASQVYFTVEESSVVDNLTVGILTDSAGAVVNVGASTIGGNGTGVLASSGSIISFGNNQTSANGSNGSFSSTAALQ
jgi:hypothetical protein